MKTGPIQRSLRGTLEKVLVQDQVLGSWGLLGSGGILGFLAVSGLRFRV